MMKDKVIIITGGSGLLGQEMISNLHQKGCKVINFDVVGESAISNKFIHCDVTNEKEIDKATEQVLEDYGVVHGLINNAYPRSSDWGTRFEEIPYASWKKNVDMQLNSAFYITQKLLIHMSKKNYGSIVNIGSIYGVVGNDWSVYEGTDIVSPAAYSAIKGGLISFTRYLAALYGPHNIRVNCVSPGGIIDRQPEKFVKAYEKKVPMKRMGRPKDIAPAVSFLLSDEAGYITGQNLIVDGGWTII